MRTVVGYRALIAAAVSSLPLMAIPLLAQEPGAAKKAAGKGSDPVRRVPQFFGQIGLSPEQREEIYKIRGQHLTQIEALQQQIERHETQMMAECEAVLTASQRRQLDERRAAAKEKTKDRAKGKEMSKPARTTPKTVK